ncbi:hypothetical protein PC9H_005783 [Pleurotus ostreatus]|uniref:peptidylprolyl isomerase n=2 Tax=Pleurotus ostreatus TaxID=5322 RepID=A0A067NDV3_PLEO1|nr:uncharacterized protein PC9H_005783 [Pleurotus ostreatus]KAF7433817.1 hypothetical protein PC9H_005783 [Pleurotus ostreatus]KDQ26203.1 hypothetical protein PLEOSDRAFT_1107066 [Pleurotus ostreatus PC15]
MPSQYIHLTNAALSLDLAAETGRSTVFITYNETAWQSPSGSPPLIAPLPGRFSLVSLKGGSKEQCLLDLILERDQRVTFEVDGENDVCLSGNLVVIEELEDIGSDDPLATTPTGNTPLPRPAHRPQNGQNHADLSVSNISSLSTPTHTSSTTTSSASKKSSKSAKARKQRAVEITESVVGKGQEVKKGDKVAIFFLITAAATKERIAMVERENQSSLPHTVVVGSESMVPGAHTGLIGMKPGGIRDVFVPAHLAYNLNPHKGKDINMTFELVEIISARGDE